MVLRNRLGPLIKLAAVVAYPYLFSSEYFIHLGVMAGMWIMLATSMNLLLGYVGQTPLGHTAFFGIGAFTAGLLSVKLRVPFWFTLPSGVVASVVAAYFIGRITLGLRGAYFVLASLGFAEVLKLVTVNWVDLTGGPMGLSGISPPQLPLPIAGRISVSDRLSYYFLMWAVVGLVLLVVHRLIHSPVGRSWLALSENEPLAEAVGVSAGQATMLALLVSGGIAGLAGVMYAHYIGFISPDVFYLLYSITMLIMVITGGKRTFAGPIFGAIVFTLVPEFLRAAQNFRMAIYGALIIAIILYLPDGLLPALANLWRAASKRRVETWRSCKPTN
ncbi:MAG: branched-chain amino acid ABC transporter permease [Actinobacteria bacterium]|nr:branched-chain amino acid ABC transporter permease [Actinomycetota bacterium]